MAGLARRLLEQPVEAWPFPWRRLERPLSRRMPADVRTRIAGAVEASIAEGARGITPRAKHRKASWRSRGLVGFAAAVLLLGVGLFTFIGKPAAKGLAVLDVAGSGAELATVGDQLAAQDAPQTRLRFKKAGRIVLGLPDGGSLGLQGPGQFLLRLNGQRLLVSINSGTAFVRRTPRSKRPLQKDGGPGIQLRWQTGRGLYTMTGTTAQLTAQKDTDTLLVLEGGFAAHKTGTAPGSDHQVHGGMALEMSTTIASRPISASEREGLLLNAGRLDGIARGTRAVDPYRHFQSESALRSFYGRLDRVELMDGRSYRGYAAAGPEWTEVHTVRGVVLIPNARIRTNTTETRAPESP